MDPNRTQASGGEATVTAGAFGSQELARAAGHLASHPALPLPDSVGGYRVLELLGRGGMGVVYRARQANPKREVALKVIGLSFVSDQLLRRFELEAQTLGRLKHVGIAQIYEAGVNPTEHGPQPFFAMELVDGAPLDEYATVKKLSPRDKLELLIKVCDAVQYAHQQGVIHRDLKPGNILVTADGQPKILDFGVARATDSDVKTTTLQTDVGQLVGTLPYMSPEQASGQPDEIDTRSDVYALGVIAYELLSGRLPHDFHNVAVPVAVRVIQEEEPGRLSSIDRTYRGDVETIVQKALEKDKTRRYATANALSADVKRYLNYEPISARPPSRWYQLSRFARRNKALVGGIVATFAVLLAGLIVSAMLYVRAESQRREAKEQGELALKTKEFLIETLQSQDPRHSGKQDITVSQAMQQALDRLSQGEVLQPRLRVELLEAIAIILCNNAQADQALPVADSAVEIRRELSPRESHELAKSIALAGYARLAAGRAADAEPLYRQAIDIHHRLNTGDDRDLATALDKLGAVRLELGDSHGASRLKEQALEMRQRVFTADHGDIASSLHSLAFLRLQTGAPAEAEPLFRRSLEMLMRLHRGDHPSVANSLDHLAQVHQWLGRLEKALEMYQQSLAMRQRIYKRDHDEIASGLANLAQVRLALGQRDDVLELAQQSLDMTRRLHPGDNPRVADGLTLLGYVQQNMADAPGAESAFRQALEMRRRLYPGEHPDVAQSLGMIGQSLVFQRRLADAEPFLRESVVMVKRVREADHPHAAIAINNLAYVCQELGHHTEAQALYEEALALHRRTSPDGSVQAAATLDNLGRVRDAQGLTAEAEPFHREALEMQRKLYRGDHPELAITLQNLASVLTRLKRLSESEPLYRESLRMARATLGVSHPTTTLIAERVAQFLDETGRTGEAAQLRAEFGVSPSTIAPATAPATTRS